MSPTSWQEDLAAATAAASVIVALEGRGQSAGAPAVYRAIYAGGWRGAGPRPDVAAPEAPIDARFVAEIVGEIDDVRFEREWTVESVCEDEALLECEGVRALARRGELDRPPIPGRPVRVASPVVSANRLPGFVHRVGREPEPPLRRIYLHLRPDAARWLVASYGRRLDRLGIGYELKVLAHQANYFRGDAGVVVVSRRDADRVANDIAARAVPGRLAPEPVSPLLTTEIAPGVSLADHPHDWDPAGRASHGLWVTDLLQWAVEQTAGKPPHEVTTMLVERIAALGRQPSSPWWACAG